MDLMLVSWVWIGMALNYYLCLSSKQWVLEERVVTEKEWMLDQGKSTWDIYSPDSTHLSHKMSSNSVTWSLGSLCMIHTLTWYNSHLQVMLGRRRFKHDSDGIILSVIRALLREVGCSFCSVGTKKEGCAYQSRSSSHHTKPARSEA